MSFGCSSAYRWPNRRTETYDAGCSKRPMYRNRIRFIRPLPWKLYCFRGARAEKTCATTAVWRVVLGCHTLFNQTTFVLSLPLFSYALRCANGSVPKSLPFYRLVCSSGMGWPRLLSIVLVSSDTAISTASFDVQVPSSSELYTVQAVPSL